MIRTRGTIFPCSEILPVLVIFCVVFLFYSEHLLRPFKGSNFDYYYLQNYPSNNNTIRSIDVGLSSSSSSSSSILEELSSSHNNGTKIAVAADDDDDDDRPWLVLHVGPPKTGTTTIQYGLEKSALQLAKEDNVYYIGIVLNKIARVGGENGDPNVTMFRRKDFISPVIPLKEFTEVLRSHKRNKHNVVISSEHLTHELINRPNYWKQMFKNLFLSSRNYTTDSGGGGGGGDDEPFFGFKVKVVVTYRHFYQWLPSWWAQSHLSLSTKHGLPPLKTNSSDSHNDSKLLYRYPGYIPGVVEYVEWFLHNIEHYTDPNINITSYPNNVVPYPDPEPRKNLVSPTSHPSIWSYLQWSSTPELYDRVDVFDMHQQNRREQHYDEKHDSNTIDDDNITEPQKGGEPNLFADFVCQMLPTAPKTCHYLNNQTYDDQFRQRVNKEIQRNTISRQDMFRITQMAQQQQRTIRTPSIVKQWFQNQDEKNNTKNLERCLSTEALERLKIASARFLQKQAWLVRKQNSERRSKSSSTLFRSSTPTSHLLLSSQQEQHEEEEADNSDLFLTSSIKTEHDKSFEEYVASGAFCEIDIERLFKNNDFIKYVFID